MIHLAIALVGFAQPAPDISYLVRAYTINSNFELTGVRTYKSKSGVEYVTSSQVGIDKMLQVQLDNRRMKVATSARSRVVDGGTAKVQYPFIRTGTGTLEFTGHFSNGIFSIAVATNEPLDTNFKVTMKPSEGLLFVLPASQNISRRLVVVYPEAVE
jgi:hypothetical protein